MKWILLIFLYQFEPVVTSVEFDSLKACETAREWVIFQRSLYLAKKGAPRGYVDKEERVSEERTKCFPAR